MSKLSDEILMAYADDELDSERAAEVEEQLKRDPSVRERLAVFTSSAACLSEAFKHELEEPVPDRLADLLRPEAAPKLDNVVPLPVRGRSNHRPIYALAASLLLAVGVGTGVLFGDLLGLGATRGAGAPVADLQQFPGWKQGLDRTRAGDAFRLHAEGGVSVEVRLLASFQDLDGRYCRTYEIDGQGVALVKGMACHAGDNWQPVLTVAEHIGPSENSVASGGAGYQPASGSSTGAFELAVEQSVSTAPFTAEREKRLISSRWRK